MLEAAERKVFEMRTKQYLLDPSVTLVDLFGWISRIRR